MKRINPLFVFTALMLFLSSCEVVGGIFKAGMIWGIFLVVLVVVGIIWLIAKGKGGSKNP
jgi:hypothetical protein